MLVDVVCMVQAGVAIDRRLRSTVDKLETLVDPFDLDVFSPHIHNHLTRQTQRSNVRTISRHDIGDIK